MIITPEYALRLFLVDSAGTITEHRVSHAVNAAVDMLTDDGYPLDKAMELMLSAEANGHDPEALARHVIKLRGALG